MWDKHAIVRIVACCCYVVVSVLHRWSPSKNPCRSYVECFNFYKLYFTASHHPSLSHSFRCGLQYTAYISNIWTVPSVTVKHFRLPDQDFIIFQVRNGAQWNERTNELNRSITTRKKHCTDIIAIMMVFVDNGQDLYRKNPLKITNFLPIGLFA